MPEIVIYAVEGRSTEQKHKLMKKITEAVVESFEVEAGSSSHAFCRLRCGNPVSDHQGHQRSVWSTPRVAEHHAQQIKRAVDQCSDSKKCSDSK